MTVATASTMTGYSFAGSRDTLTVRESSASAWNRAARWAMASRSRPSAIAPASRSAMRMRVERSLSSSPPTRASSTLSTPRSSPPAISGTAISLCTPDSATA